MIIDGKSIDSAQLMSTDELLKHLRENGESEAVLSEIFGGYYATFDDELTWFYPIPNTEFNGAVIIAVQEGFLYLPYYYVDKTEHEMLELDSAHILTLETVCELIDDFKEFSHALLKGLEDMLSIISGEQP